MTPRRLLVLIRGLPYDAAVWAAQERAEKAAQVARPERIRDRAAYWAAKAN